MIDLPGRAGPEPFRGLPQVYQDAGHPDQKDDAEREQGDIQQWQARVEN
jgi:hypothetical protein